LRFLDPVTLESEAEVSLTPNFALTSIRSVPGSGLLAVSSESGQVFFVDPARRAVVGDRLAAQGAQLLAVAPSPDGARIAAVGWDGALRLWDRASGRALGPPLDAHGDYTRGIAWLDNEHLLTGSGGGSLIAWHLSPSSWVERACELAGRDLTRSEWARYLPDQPFRRTCTA
jgi:WD40 repeat protein